MHAQPRGDGSARCTLDDQRQHLPLAGRELQVAQANLVLVQPRAPRRQSRRDRAQDRRQEPLLQKRRLDDIHGATLDRLDRARDVRLPASHDDRQVNAARPERPPHLRDIHRGVVPAQHETARLVRGQPDQERIRIRIGADAKPRALGHATNPRACFSAIRHDVYHGCDGHYVPPGRAVHDRWLVAVWRHARASLSSDNARAILAAARRYLNASPMARSKWSTPAQRTAHRVTHAAGERNNCRLNWRRLRPGQLGVYLPNCAQTTLVHPRGEPVRYYRAANL